VITGNISWFVASKLVLLRPINSFRKVAEHKISTQLGAFLHIKKEHTEKEIRETTPCTIALKYEYQRINLIKEIKDLYDQN
jgi:hypothetical protein